MRLLLRRITADHCLFLGNCTYNITTSNKISEREQKRETQVIPFKKNK
jgi:hypothetical protein